MKDFCIASLTHCAEYRADALWLTYSSFYNNTDWEGGLDVYLLVNGTMTPDMEKVVYKLNSEFGNCNLSKYFNFHFHESDVNLGCSIGINCVNALSNNHKYVLFLEGDWILIKGCAPTDWLTKCLNYLDESNADMIYLRKFENSYKIRHHGSHWAFTNPSNYKDEFRKIDNPIYTNNPIIRRNSSFYENGIFPLPEYSNDFHGYENWGKSEIEIENKCNSMNAYYYKFGIFIHYEKSCFENNEYVFKPLCCPFYDKCKFGFIDDCEPMFCAVCSDKYEETVTDVDERYVRLHYALGKKKMSFDIHIL